MALFEKLPEPVCFALTALERAGYEAALVGGCVRDALMGRSPGDYDVATSALPQETQAALAGERVLPTGIRHGTVTLVRGGMPVEITAFREDGAYADMRRPDTVTFTRSLETDVRRRDFTMNALAWEPSRGLIDYVGGREDIGRGLIRAVGDPFTRFSEDALRILRAMRFSAQLGFAVCPETERALFRLQANLSYIARERVRQELFKLICGPAARAALLRYEEVLRGLFDCGASLSGAEWALGARRVEALAADGRALADGACESPVALPLSALLLSAGADAAAGALRSLRSDAKTAERAALLIRLYPEMRPEMRALRALCGEHGFSAVWDAARLRYAFDGAGWEAASAYLLRIRREKLPCAIADLAVNGTDLRAAGVSGRRTGAVLRALLQEVQADELENTKAALLSRAAGYRAESDK